jgi:hypothetical protein
MKNSSRGDLGRAEGNGPLRFSRNQALMIANADQSRRGSLSPRAPTAKGLMANSYSALRRTMRRFPTARKREYLQSFCRRDILMLTNNFVVPAFIARLYRAAQLQYEQVLLC